MPLQAPASMTRKPQKPVNFFIISNGCQCSLTNDALSHMVEKVCQNSYYRLSCYRKSGKRLTRFALWPLFPFCESHYRHMFSLTSDYFYRQAGTAIFSLDDNRSKRKVWI